MPVRRFRKRPVEVGAVQWTGLNLAELAAFTGGRFADEPQDGGDYPPEVTGWVHDVLHSSWVGVKTGDWVIGGVAGEFYPIDPAVLARTYTPVVPGTSHDELIADPRVRDAIAMFDGTGINPGRVLDALADAKAVDVAAGRVNG